MTRTRVLVTNEPRSYREAIAAVFRWTQPGLVVVVVVVAVEPDGLDAGVERCAPDLVVCSRETEKARGRAPARIGLYPEGEAGSVMIVDGEEQAVGNVQLSDLLSVVDGL